MNELPATPHNIAAVAAVELPIAHGDHRSMRQYRAAGDLVRYGGECVVQGIIEDCSYDCTPESSLCGRYVAVLTEVAVQETEI